MSYHLVLLGDPVDHSFSPAIHAAALAAQGLTGTYTARRVDEPGVREAFAELRAGNLTGLNVTMPHKALAASLCDLLDPDAERAGSVNTAFMRDGLLMGLSTDIGGIRDVWSALPAIGPVLVLGSGGAAAAACVALADHPLYVGVRRPGKGRELSELGLEIGELTWEVPVAGAVVVNCTPLGMKGEILPRAVLGLAAGILDMAYGPEVTPAVKYMQEQGRPAVTGLDLLLAQAARSFSAWTGLNPPIQAMRAAVGNP